MGVLASPQTRFVMGYSKKLAPAPFPTALMPDVNTALSDSGRIPDG